MSKSSVAVAALLFLGARAVAAQDLFERARAQRGQATVETREYQSGDRLNLRVGGALPTLAPEKGSARLGLEASFESDFACGRFDIKATLKNLLGREARDEWLDALLGALESELVHNALVLACEASPTACQAFQHFRVNANAMLGIGHDRCQAIESAIQTSFQGIRANAIKDCVEEKRRGGMAMQDALEACQNSTTMRGRDGAQVREINLVDELTKAFGLSGIDAQNLASLLGALRISPTGAKGEISGDGVLRKFDRLEEKYRTAWTDATKTAGENSTWAPSADAMKVLWPPGALALPTQDVGRIARMPQDKRQVYIRRVAGRAALVELTLEVQKVERMLRAMRTDPNADAGTAKLLERQVEDLRLQLAHIDELLRRYDEWNGALLTAAEAADAREIGLAARTVTDARRTAEAKAHCLPEYGRRGCEVKR